jgi:hypothetical protein
MRASLKLWTDTWQLGLEAQRVIAMRLARISVSRRVAQHGAGEFGKEALDEIEPGAVLESESEFEPVRGLAGEPSSGLFGDMRIGRSPGGGLEPGVSCGAHASK